MLFSSPGIANMPTVFAVFPKPQRSEQGPGLQQRTNIRDPEERKQPYLQLLFMKSKLQSFWI